MREVCDKDKRADESEERLSSREERDDDDSDDHLDPTKGY